MCAKVQSVMERAWWWRGEEGREEDGEGGEGGRGGGREAREGGR